MLCNLQTAFSTTKDFGREAREAAWAAEQRTLHGLDAETKLFSERTTFKEISLIAEEARKRAEIARFLFSVFFPFHLMFGEFIFFIGFSL